MGPFNAFRRDLHAHPELGYNEFLTADEILQRSHAIISGERRDDDISPDGAMCESN